MPMSEGRCELSAVIIDFCRFKEFRPAPRQRRVASRATASASESNFLFWSGQSGRCYVHSVYNLRECPEIPAATYLLVRSEVGEAPRVLMVGRLEGDAPSLNLAEIRRLGALLEANEVHIHLLAQSPAKRQAVEQDLALTLTTSLPQAMAVN